MAGNTRSAPVGDRLRKAQVNTDCRSLKTMVALFRVRLCHERFSRRALSFLRVNRLPTLFNNSCLLPKRNELFRPALNRSATDQE